MKPTPHQVLSDLSVPELSRWSGSESVLLSEILKPYSDGEQFDVKELLNQHPYLSNMPSLMVDLAFEDYWRKRQNGHTIDTDRFVDQFPTIRDRLLHIIDVGDLINQSPHLFMGLIKPEWPSVPSELGPFLLVRKIGEGAFSRVYLAKDRSLADRAVTLKVTQHAVREAEALGRLQHPNIVSPLGLYDQLLPGLQVISMPFVGRTTLADLIHHRVDAASPEQEADFDFREFLNATNAEFAEYTDPESVAPTLTFLQTAAWIGAHVADGLASAHAKEFLHCDIKPSNILLRQNGLPLILDFNLSVSSKQIACTGGTLTYIAPEQLRSIRPTGDAEQQPALTGAVDTYALGATLIELIQGKPPFGKISTNSNGERPRHPLDLGAEPFQFAAPLRKKLGPVTAELLESCVALDPTFRPSLKELSNHLHRFAQPLEKRPLSGARRFALVASLGSILLLSMGTAWTIITAPSPQERFQLGVNALVEEGSPRAAVRHFSRLLAADPSRLDARALRACGFMQREDWQLAAMEFRQLSKEQPNNRELNALTAYAMCRWQQQYQIAEYEYGKAFDKGLRRTDVLNNLAYCQIRMNRLNAALETLALAREQAPDLPVLIFNEACVELKLARELKTVPLVEYADAIVNHPELTSDREALIVAANIYWGSARKDRNYWEKTFECLERGIKSGLTVADLENLPGKSLLKSDPRYDGLMQRAAQNPATDGAEVGIARLVSPPIDNRDYLNGLVASLTRNGDDLQRIAMNSYPQKRR